MQPCPGRVFPNDTLNRCMRPLRLSFLLALAWMPSVLSAQARLPTGAQALDPASGRVVYEERRSALEARLDRLVEAARRHEADTLRDDVVVLAIERVST